MLLLHLSFFFFLFFFPTVLLRFLYLQNIIPICAASESIGVVSKAKTSGSRIAVKVLS